MKIITNKPIAVDSFDHIEPLGAAHDNFTSEKFNTALYAFRNIYQLPDKCDLRVLDLGCSGGGFVESLLKDGCAEAIGIEGSDAPLRAKRDAWGRIPEKLFTADVTEPFGLRERDDGPDAYFHLVTAWEFMEHISIQKLGRVLHNISRHTLHMSLFIGTINTQPCGNERGNWHQTIKPEWWWRDFFRQNGFAFDDRLIAHFEGKWLRDEANAPVPTSFGFVARAL